MMAFIRNYNLITIRKKLIILYVLNVTDIIFTVLLLQTGYFAEINILMVDAVQFPLVGILLKIILPAILLLYLYKRLCGDNNSYLRATNIGVNISLSLYALVNLSHLLWTALLPVFNSLYI